VETPLQQRLVGAIVLVALGVIFIPAILDGSGYKSRHARSIEIPERPVFPPLSQDRLEPIPTPLDATFKKQSEQRTKKPEKTAKLKSWMLQIGTFENKKNAEKYRDEMRKKGYTTQVFTDTSKGKTSYKVRIGPDLDKQRMQTLRDKLKKQGIDGYIVSRG
jgi:DedD protein